MPVVEDRVERRALLGVELEAIVEKLLGRARILAPRISSPDAISREPERPANEDGAEQKHHGEVLRALHCRSSSGGNEGAKRRVPAAALAPRNRGSGDWNH